MLKSNFIAEKPVILYHCIWYINTLNMIQKINFGFTIYLNLYILQTFDKKALLKVRIKTKIKNKYRSIIASWLKSIHFIPSFHSAYTISNDGLNKTLSRDNLPNVRSVHLGWLCSVLFKDKFTRPAIIPTTILAIILATMSSYQQLWFTAFIKTQIIEVSVGLLTYVMLGLLSKQFKKDYSLLTCTYIGFVFFTATTFTHPLLWFVLPIYIQHCGLSYTHYVLLGELLVWFSEALWYYMVIDQLQRRFILALLLSLLLNGASYCLDPYLDSIL